MCGCSAGESFYQSGGYFTDPNEDQYGGASRRKSKSRNLANMTREALYERAKALNIVGRSTMSKEELIEAIRARRGKPMPEKKKKRASVSRK